MSSESQLALVKRTALDQLVAEKTFERFRHHEVGFVDMIAHGLQLSEANLLEGRITNLSLDEIREHVRRLPVANLISILVQGALAQGGLTASQAEDIIRNGDVKGAIEAAERVGTSAIQRANTNDSLLRKVHDELSLASNTAARTAGLTENINDCTETSTAIRILEAAITAKTISAQDLSWVLTSHSGRRNALSQGGALTFIDRVHTTNTIASTLKASKRLPEKTLAALMSEDDRYARADLLSKYEPLASSHSELCIFRAKQLGILTDADIAWLNNPASPPIERINFLNALSTLLKDNRVAANPKLAELSVVSWLKFGLLALRSPETPSTLPAPTHVVDAVSTLCSLASNLHLHSMLPVTAQQKLSSDNEFINWANKINILSKLRERMNVAIGAWKTNNPFWLSLTGHSEDTGGKPKNQLGSIDKLIKVGEVVDGTKDKLFSAKAIESLSLFLHQCFFLLEHKLLQEQILAPIETPEQFIRLVNIVSLAERIRASGPVSAEPFKFITSEGLAWLLGCTSVFPKNLPASSELVGRLAHILNLAFSLKQAGALEEELFAKLGDPNQFAQTANALLVLEQVRKAGGNDTTAFKYLTQEGLPWVLAGATCDENPSSIGIISDDRAARVAELCRVANYLLAEELLTPEKIQDLSSPEGFPKIEALITTYEKRQTDTLLCWQSASKTLGRQLTDASTSKYSLVANERAHEILSQAQVVGAYLNKLVAIRPEESRKKMQELSQTYLGYKVDSGLWDRYLANYNYHIDLAFWRSQVDDNSPAKQFELIHRSVWEEITEGPQFEIRALAKSLGVYSGEVTWSPAQGEALKAKVQETEKMALQVLKCTETSMVLVQALRMGTIPVSKAKQLLSTPDIDTRYRLAQELDVLLINHLDLVARKSEANSRAKNDSIEAPSPAQTDSPFALQSNRRFQSLSAFVTTFSRDTDTLSVREALRKIIEPEHFKFLCRSIKADEKFSIRRAKKLLMSSTDLEKFRPEILSLMIYEANIKAMIAFTQGKIITQSGKPYIDSPMTFPRKARTNFIEECSVCRDIVDFKKVATLLGIDRKKFKPKPPLYYADDLIAHFNRLRDALQSDSAPDLLCWTPEKAKAQLDSLASLNR